MEMKARQKKRKVQRWQRLSNHNQYYQYICFIVLGLAFQLSVFSNQHQTDSGPLTLLNKIVKGRTANGYNPAGTLPRRGGGGDDFCSINYISKTKTKTGGGEGQGEGEGVVCVLRGRGNR